MNMTKITFKAFMDSLRADDGKTIINKHNTKCEVREYDDKIMNINDYNFIIDGSMMDDVSDGLYCFKGSVDFIQVYLFERGDYILNVTNDAIKYLYSHVMIKNLQDTAGYTLSMITNYIVSRAHQIILFDFYHGDHEAIVTTYRSILEKALIDQGLSDDVENTLDVFNTCIDVLSVQKYSEVVGWKN